MQLSSKQKALLCTIPRSAIGLWIEFQKEEHQTALELQELGFLEAVPQFLDDKWFQARVLKY